MLATVSDSICASWASFPMWSIRSMLTGLPETLSLPFSVQSPFLLHWFASVVLQSYASFGVFANCILKSTCISNVGGLLSAKWRISSIFLIFSFVVPNYCTVWRVALNRPSINKKLRHEPSPFGQQMGVFHRELASCRVLFGFFWLVVCFLEDGGPF